MACSFDYMDRRGRHHRSHPRAGDQHPGAVGDGRGGAYGARAGMRQGRGRQQPPRTSGGSTRCTNAASITGWNSRASTRTNCAAWSPRARTLGHALWSPTTRVADPGHAIRAMLVDAVGTGVQIHLSTRVTDSTANWLQTTKGSTQRVMSPLPRDRTPTEWHGLRLL